jgi:ATP-binding cassette subfamily B protein
LIADIACAVIVAIIALTIPLFARHITENLLAPDTPDAAAQIITVGAIMAGLLVIQTLCNTYVDYQGHMMGSLMERDMRAELFAHYQQMPVSFYDEQRTGQLMSRLTNDLMAISELAHHGPEEAIIAALKFTGAFVILLTINTPVTLIIFALLPVMALYSLVFNRRLNTALAQSKARIGDVHAQVEDTLDGIRVVKSFTNEALEQRKFDAANERFVQSRRDGYRSEAWFYSGMSLFIQCITLGIIVLGALAILNASLSLPDLLTYLLFVAILIDPIQKFVNLARLVQEGVTGFDRFMDIMEMQPDIQDSPSAIELPAVRGHIQFDDVRFRYRDDYDDVLRNLDLEIEAGEYVALVGTSGVGKTTLCALIPRFYDVTDGAIRVDGHDIRDVTLASLRRNIGVVQQDVYLFAGTVAENIRYGKPEATHAQVVAAAKQANAHGFISALPEGYDTDIGQHGVKLSGGQKQRLSIARVFLKDPPIIIFDEATSALDNESEKAIQDSFEALSRNRTTIVIAHRLSTIRNAQRIIVLTDKGIGEQGTHAQLIERNGRYAQLVQLQATL